MPWRRALEGHRCLARESAERASDPVPLLGSSLLGCVAYSSSGESEPSLSESKGVGSLGIGAVDRCPMRLVLRCCAYGWAFALVATGCGDGKVPVGGICADAFDCTEEAVCFSVPGSEARCMMRCAIEQVVCIDGEVCMAAASAAGPHVCYLGGVTGVGQPCTDASTCELGATCVDVGDGTPSRCFEVCDRRAPRCPLGQVCTTLEDPGGFCQVEAPTP